MSNTIILWSNAFLTPFTFFMSGTLMLTGSVTTKGVLHKSPNQAWANNSIIKKYLKIIRYSVNFSILK